MRFRRRPKRPLQPYDRNELTQIWVGLVVLAILGAMSWLSLQTPEGVLIVSIPGTATTPERSVQTLPSTTPPRPATTTTAPMAPTTTTPSSTDFTGVHCDEPTTIREVLRELRPPRWESNISPNADLFDITDTTTRDLIVAAAEDYARETLIGDPTNTDNGAGDPTNGEPNPEPAPYAEAFIRATFHGLARGAVCDPGPATDFEVVFLVEATTASGDTNIGTVVVALTAIDGVVTATGLAPH